MVCRQMKQICCGNWFGGVLNKCLYREVQPLTLLYTIFHEKGAPFVFILLTNGAALAYPV